MKTIFNGFDEIFRSDASFDELLRGLYSSETHTLNVDVDLDEDDYVIRAEVPGLKQEDVDISYSNNTILIVVDYGEKGNAFRKGKYTSKFKLVDVDVDKIKAELNDGILKISLPKSEEKKARKINIG